MEEEKILLGERFSGLPLFLTFLDRKFLQLRWFVYFFEETNFPIIAEEEARRRFSHRPKYLEIIEIYGGLGTKIDSDAKDETEDVIFDENILPHSPDNQQPKPQVKNRLQRYSLEKAMAVEIISQYDKGLLPKYYAAKEALGENMGERSFARAWATARDRRPAIGFPGRPKGIQKLK